MLQEIREIWFDCCLRYSSDSGVAEKLWDEIRRRYTSSQRHYHNLVHINHLLQLEAQYKQHLADRDVVLLSIFYHDIVYSVVRKDNEARSAAIAEKRLARLNLPSEKIQSISEFIKATQTHIIPEGAPHAGDLAWFLDFDMAILAEPWSRYERYAQQVRKEYRIYPDMLYNPGRKKFLQNTIASGHVYHTDWFREHHEAAALANMERELEWYK
ncbi:hypothetical protein [Paraflavitalea sp. CAU 1676]|uniref:HD domain-containing protein n=1 Tax=Paraflavitalea sp. CAU 1676 TaxID=3032598 RepID=UPI0023DCB2C4|nr:hypothetical protein [Paraflavitalea sp. CAU 1676]MDF2191928.1 hypothetical protein [Paraflavitalea sp. CAU 1676]